jgi:diguanylate cyclase (GGDEF)-like protein/PAS domain S-box-containing protein
MTVAKERVLLVDDEPQMLVALEDLLLDEFDVIKTGSPEQALRVVKEERDIAVVVSDQRMPKMTGDELFTCLNGQSKATRILITGFADLTAVIRAVNNGNIFAYITKPWSAEDFRLIVRRGAEYFRLAQELAYRHQLLQDLMNNIPDGVYFKDLDLNFTEVNRSFATLLGHDSARSLIGMRLGQLAPQVPDSASLEGKERRILSECRPEIDMVQPWTVHGETRWISESRAPIRDLDGKVVGLVGIARDVTIRKQQEDRIARLTRIHAMRGSISSAVLRIQDRHALLRELCRVAIDIGQFSLAAIVQGRGDPQEALVAAEPAEHAFVDTLAGRLATRPWREGSILQRAAETERPVIASEADIAADDPLASGLAQQRWRAVAAFPLLIAEAVDSVFVLFSATSSRVDPEEERLLEELTSNVAFALSHIRQSEQMALLAYHDALTSLPNRHLLRERMSQCIAASDKFALLLIDVTRFRHINETLGWSAGDELLVELAKRLGATLSQRDTLARVDGNVFAVLFGSIDDGSDVALYVENHLISLMRHAFELQRTELRVALCSGISLFPADGRTPDVLIGNAETALRSAKTAGSSYTFYAPHMNARVAEKLTLETKLRVAIEQEEFLLHYQPKVDVKTGTICGLEALVRWQGKDGVLIPPGMFIPVLEETGLIVEAGRWILQRAARQHAEWLARGLKVPRIAVNVSARQLGQKDFVDSVDALFRPFPDAASGIDLEITESVFVDNLKDSADKLRTLRERGFQVAIDDFGTGYSSLGYLSRLPIDALKIDRSFIERMFDDAQDMSIVTTVISLAHALELKVIAEGVETVQQAHQLRLMRCDQLQGYLTAKPQRPEQVEALFGTILLNTRRSAESPGM